jgi:4-amino-4-deoxy-L-arabinose transferase-like glycosyltransferase
VSVLLVGLALLYHFGSLPEGSHHDEVSIGFNARSIWKTGADQYGVLLPLYFKGTGDWKGPVALYATVASTAVLGNRSIALRTPGLLFAVGAAVLVGWCIRDQTGRIRLARWLSLLFLLIPSVFLYARSGTTEPVAFLFLFAAAVASLRFYARAPSFARAALAGTVFGLAAYAYPAARLMMPFAVAVATVSFLLDPGARRTAWVIPTCAAAAALPMAIFMLVHPGALFARLDSMSIFRPGASAADTRRLFVTNYLSHWSLDFLFRQGQQGHRHWHNIGTGFLSLWMLLPFVFGLATILRRLHDPFGRFLFFALVLAPVPAALTTDDVPHPNRILFAIPIVVLICATGIASWLGRAQPSAALVALLLGACVYEGATMVLKYFDDYPVTFERENPGGWDGGVGRAIQLAVASREEGEPLYLPSSFFDFDGILVGFWGDLDPRRFRQSGLDAFDIHRAIDSQGLAAGTLWMTDGQHGPPFPADPVGSVEAAVDGKPLWSLFRRK